MERLTCKSCGENVLRGCCTFDRESNTEPDDVIPCNEICGEYAKTVCDECPIQKAFDRLAAYEDTGLMPEEIGRYLDNYGDNTGISKKLKGFWLKHRRKAKETRS